MGTAVSLSRTSGAAVESSGSAPRQRLEIRLAARSATLHILPAGCRTNRRCRASRRGSAAAGGSASREQRPAAHHAHTTIAPQLVGVVPMARVVAILFKNAIRAAKPKVQLARVFSRVENALLAHAASTTNGRRTPALNDSAASSANRTRASGSLTSNTVA